MMEKYMAQVSDAEVLTTLLHGTRSVSIDRFDLKHCEENRPFGPAIYLTADLDVARCYVRPPGGVYEVTLTGKSCYTINLDRHIEEQSPQASRAIQFLFNEIGLSVEHSHDDVRDLLDLVSNKTGKRQRNYRLAAFGIWMLYGQLSAIENSGLCDKGVQYAVIHEGAILRHKKLSI
jgi:hypothetical protein